MEGATAIISCYGGPWLLQLADEAREQRERFDLFQKTDGRGSTRSIDQKGARRSFSNLILTMIM